MRVLLLLLLLVLRIVQVLLYCITTKRQRLRGVVVAVVGQCRPAACQPVHSTRFASNLRLLLVVKLVVRLALLLLLLLQRCCCKPRACLLHLRYVLPFAVLQHVVVLLFAAARTRQ